MELKILIEQVFLATWKSSTCDWISWAIPVVLTSGSGVYKNVYTDSFCYCYL